MANFLSPLSPKSKAKNRSRNDADNTTKSRNIQKTVVNVIVPDHDDHKNKQHQHDCRRFW